MAFADFALRPFIRVHDLSIDDRRRLMLIHNALTRLTLRKRETIKLFYLLEHSVGDIARLLRSSPSAVKMTLLRGRQELMQRVGADLPHSCKR